MTTASRHFVTWAKRGKKKGTSSQDERHLVHRYSLSQSRLEMMDDEELPLITVAAGYDHTIRCAPYLLLL